MAERLQIIIDAKDRFSGPFRKLRSSMPALRTAALAAGAAFAAMGGAAIGAGAKFIKLASDMEETTNKFNVVFRDQIDIASKWADEISAGYFTSREEARRFLSSVQDLLVPMGLNSKAAGELSNRIVRLSADLGSFNNLPTERVISDIQSALVGNYETVKKYGVVLTATAVQQRALNDGLADSKEELTAADKALTAYKIILESSQAAVGDMARSSQSWANQMKLARAQLTDIGTEIGQRLLVVATPLLIQFNEFIKQNKEIIVLKTAEWLKRVGTILLEVGRALAWVDDNITDKILDFFFGPSKFSRLENLKDQLKRAQQALTQLNIAIEAGAPISEASIKLQEDKIKLLKQEIAEYSNLKKAVQETPKAPEIGNLPEIKLPKITVPEIDIPEIKVYDNTKSDIDALNKLWASYYQTQSEQITAWQEEQQTKFSENAQALALINGIASAQQQELRNKEIEEEAQKLQTIRDLHMEYFGTELEQLQAWYEQQREQYAGYQEELVLLDELYAEKKAGIEEALQQKKVALQNKTFSDIISSMKAFGKQGFAIAKAFEIAQATMAAYRSFTNTLATASEYFLPPIPEIMAGAALAAGLARVASIATTKYGGAAHGGLENIPREQTYLLDRGERVLSPQQNRDLTEFLSQSGNAGSTNIDLTLNVLQPLDTVDWDALVEDDILPALTRLNRAGIKI